MSAELECIHMCMHLLTSRLTHAYGIISATILFSNPSHNSCLHLNTQAPAPLKSNGHLRAPFRLLREPNFVPSPILNQIAHPSRKHLRASYKQRH